MINPKQLTFPWSKSNRSELENFFFDEKNLKLKDILLSDEDFFLYGGNKVGKTYLMQSLCNLYSKKDKTSLYIPLRDILNFDTSFLDSLDSLDLICVDDINLINGRDKWELAFFNLINNCLTSKCRLIFCSSINPYQLAFELKDLESRIKRLDSFEILPVSDSNLVNALNFIAKSRTINLGMKELNYLVKYSKRSVSSLTKLINKLDKLSMEQKRKITIPLIKETI
tara:strand:+ start:155 stop:832 length:678 start_codon:yes stop_codon:yes gene_type:complete